MGLSSVMLEALHAAAYQEPTPVQAGVIPLALKGLDVMGQARTGTGKTAAFAIPILERLAPQKGASPQALILVPTRELAVQVRDEIANSLLAGARGRVAALRRQTDSGQIDKLRRGAESSSGPRAACSTTSAAGRSPADDSPASCWTRPTGCSISGFGPTSKRSCGAVPRQRQTLLLSATVPPPVERLAKRYMHDPEQCQLLAGDVSVETIEQFYFTVDGERKFDLLVRLLEREQPRQAIVFCRTRRGTDRVAQRLKKRIDSVGCIHGDMEQTGPRPGHAEFPRR